MPVSCPCLCSLPLLTPPSPCLSLAPIPSASPLSAPSCLGMLLSLAGCWSFWAGTCRRPGSCYYYWELLLSKERSHMSWIRRQCLASVCLILTNSTYSLHTAPSYPQVQGRRHSKSCLRTCEVTQGTEEGATSEFWWVERSALTHPHPRLQRCLRWAFYAENISRGQALQPLDLKLSHLLSIPQTTWFWRGSCQGTGQSTGLAEGRVISHLGSAAFSSAGKNSKPST